MLAPKKVTVFEADIVFVKVAKKSDLRQLLIDRTSME